MLIPENVEAVCNITRTDELITLLVIDPNGRTGGFTLELKDVPLFLERIKTLCPEIEKKADES